LTGYFCSKRDWICSRQHLHIRSGCMHLSTVAEILLGSSIESHSNGNLKRDNSICAMIQHVLAPRYRGCPKRCLNQPFTAAIHSLYLCKLKTLRLGIKTEALRHSPSPHELGNDCNPNICQSIVDVDLHLPKMVMCLQVYLQRHLLPVHCMTINGGGL
jgi:hypothetical protein